MNARGALIILMAQENVSDGGMKMEECPRCHQPSLIYDPYRKVAKCLRLKCGYGEEMSCDEYSAKQKTPYDGATITVNGFTLAEIWRMARQEGRREVVGWVNMNIYNPDGKSLTIWAFPYKEWLSQVRKELGIE